MPCSSPPTDLRAAQLQNPMLTRLERSSKPRWCRIRMFLSHVRSLSMRLPFFLESRRRHSVCHLCHFKSSLQLFRSDSPRNSLIGDRTSPLRNVELQNRTNKSELPEPRFFRRSY